MKTNQHDNKKQRTGLQKEYFRNGKLSSFGQRNLPPKNKISKLNSMNKGLVAKASITIYAPIAKVWDALVNPDKIKQYMFGTDAVSDWKEGSSIIWKGVWEGKPYEDKGLILKIEPERMVQYNHFSPLSGQADVPENYHTVTIELSDDDSKTLLSLSQDNNSTEQAREHSEKNWGMILTGLKKLVEK